MKALITEYIYALDEMRASNGKGAKLPIAEYKRRQDRLARAEQSLRDAIAPPKAGQPLPRTIDPIKGTVPIPTVFGPVKK